MKIQLLYDAVKLKFYIHSVNALSGAFRSYHPLAKLKFCRCFQHDAAFIGALNVRHYLGYTLWVLFGLSPVRPCLGGEGKHK